MQYDTHDDDESWGQASVSHVRAAASHVQAAASHVQEAAYHS